MLQSALDLIEMLNDEVTTLRAAMADAKAFSEAQAAAVADAEAKADQLAKLLHQSDEGLSEALIVLAAMRAGLGKISEAANAAIAKFTDVGFASGVTQDVAKLSNALASANDKVLLEAHESYLRDLRNRIGVNKG